jgi:hypothetical protein
LLQVTVLLIYSSKFSSTHCGRAGSCSGTEIELESHAESVFITNPDECCEKSLSPDNRGGFIFEKTAAYGMICAGSGRYFQATLNWKNM